MGEKLTHREHKIIITILVIISMIVGLVFGRYVSGLNEKNDIIIILIFGMVFMIAILLAVILSILTRMEEDIYWNIKKKI